MGFKSKAIAVSMVSVVGMSALAGYQALNADYQIERQEIETSALATRTAIELELLNVELEEQRLELLAAQSSIQNQIALDAAQTQIQIEREYQLAWVWTSTKGVLIGMIAVVPVAIGGLILWRVIERKRKEDQDYKLIEITANGALPISREFLLNQPQQVFEFAAIRAEMDARAKLAAASQPNLPSLTTLTHSPTFSPSTTTTNDKELLMMAQARQLESEEDQNKGAEGEKATIIYELLEGQGVPVYVRLLATGPQCETYSIRPGRKIVKNRMKRITVREVLKHEADIAMALSVPSVRMEQCGGYLACEVARKEREFVSLENMIRSEEWQAALDSMELPLALGQDTLGENVILDLCRMPHFLAGGATSMGKSVLIRSIITSLALQPTEKVSLILVDPKEVEFEPFKPVPHVSKIITNMDQAANSLESALLEMDRRAKLFKAKGVQKLSEYNAKSREKLPYIVIIIDELADLMATNKDEVEDLIVRIAQKARFAGIHLILATQRPDADTITPLIRANIPARCSVRTMTSGDSRTILDETGAEKLLDQGDSLIKTAQLPTTRMQASYTSAEGAIKLIKLAQDANKKAGNNNGTDTEQERNNSGTRVVQERYNGNGNKNGTANGTANGTITEQIDIDKMTVETRANYIVMLHQQGHSETAILKVIWGKAGGRKDKERRQEIRTAIANLELNGHN